MIAKVLLIAALASVSIAQRYGAPAPYAAPAHYAAPAAYQEHYQPQPYDFGYETNDDYGTTTFRRESGDGSGRVQGSYGYKDHQGIERVVEYVADEHGYRAQVKTNEPGTDNQNPADVHMNANPIVVEQPHAYGAPQRAYAAPRPQYAAPEHGWYRGN